MTSRTAAYLKAIRDYRIAVEHEAIIRHAGPDRLAEWPDALNTLDNAEQALAEATEQLSSRSTAPSIEPLSLAGNTSNGREIL